MKRGSLFSAEAVNLPNYFIRKVVKKLIAYIYNDVIAVLGNWIVLEN